MSFDKAAEFVKSKGYGDRITVFDTSSATVELAAAALKTEAARIAKSLTFSVCDRPVLIVCAGDGRISNSKFKDFFGVKAKMLTYEEVSRLIGHDVGGVCPFGINDGVRVYFDVSMKRFETVYPACGSGNSCVRLKIAEFSEICGDPEWIDVCNLPEA